jgi:hypothetical protein
VPKQSFGARRFEGAVGADEGLPSLFVAGVFRFRFSEKFEQNVRFANVKAKHLKRLKKSKFTKRLNNQKS